MAECLWARIGTDFTSKPWMQGQSAGVKLAFLEMVLHVKAYCPSQKKPGRSASMPIVKAARTWEISPEEVELMISLAVAAGDLIVMDGTWEITDKTHFVSQRTMDSLKNAEDNHVLQDSADFAEKGASLYGTDTETVTETNSKEETSSTADLAPQAGEDGGKRKRSPSRKWGQVYEELKSLLPESHHACLKDWCVYAKEKKYPAWVELTVRKNAAEWREWPVERLGAMVDHTIKKSWQGLQEPEKPKQFAQPNGKPSSPQPITVEQAQAMITGEGLEDRGSPVTGRRFSGGQN